MLTDDDTAPPTVTPFVIVQISHCCGNVVRFSLVKSPLAEGHCGIIPRLVPRPPAPSGVRSLNPAYGVGQFTGPPPGAIHSYAHAKPCVDWPSLPVPVPPQDSSA